MRLAMPTAAALFEKVPPGLRRHKLMTAWMRLTGEDPLQLVRIRDDSFGYADMSDGFLRLIVIEGDFERDFFAVADAILGGGGTFFDVGANHGLLSFGLAGRHRDRVRFHLFEPNPRLVESIERTLRSYPFMRCRVNPLAVSDRDGVVSFAVNDAQTGASHIVSAGGRPVRATTLDRYIAETGTRRVDLLKLDVEGCELLALRGAECALGAHAIRAIYFEYFEKYLMRVQPPRALPEYLHAMGYEVCFCRPCDIGPRGRPTHTIRAGLPGHGLPLLPVHGFEMPPMTDLLAIPRVDLARNE